MLSPLILPAGLHDSSITPVGLCGLIGNDAAEAQGALSTMVVSASVPVLCDERSPTTSASLGMEAELSSVVPTLM